jgi:hypothetical protein
MYPLCETCGVLTGLLIAATHKLTVATARMAGLAGTGQHALFKVAEVETRTLQEECGRINSELEHTRHSITHAQRTLRMLTA